MLPVIVLSCLYLVEILNKLKVSCSLLKRSGAAKYGARKIKYQSGGENPRLRQKYTKNKQEIWPASIFFQVVAVAADLIAKRRTSPANSRRQASASSKTTTTVSPTSVAASRRLVPRFRASQAAAPLILAGGRQRPLAQRPNQLSQNRRGNPQCQAERYGQLSRKPVSLVFSVFAWKEGNY